jgi:hypothetical protein
MQAPQGCAAARSLQGSPKLHETLNAMKSHAMRAAGTVTSWGGGRW